MTKYLFTSNRLGFREWNSDDLPIMASINADPKVMEFFPSIQSVSQTEDFIKRNQRMFAENRFCYFAVELLETNELIGFIGLSQLTFESSFTPCVDIGWRIGFKYWNCGYATEGAKRCLQYAFEDLKLKEVFSVAPVINVKSIAIMHKIGMLERTHFEHPLLNSFDYLKKCALFFISNN
jgi:RimJ/RimL family protein N-acetyltransferase